MTVSATDVKAITGSTLDDAVIDLFIVTAGFLITQAAECANVSDAQEEQAHTYLAAHLLVTSNVGKASAAIKREKLEDVYDVTYDVGATGEDVRSTEFGRTANMLMGGCLAEMGKQPPALHVIGAHGGDALC